MLYIKKNLSFLFFSLYKESESCEMLRSLFFYYYPVINKRCSDTVPDSSQGVRLHDGAGKFISGGEPVNVCNDPQETRAIFMEVILLNAYYDVVNGFGNGGRVKDTREGPRQRNMLARLMRRETPPHKRNQNLRVYKSVPRCQGKH